MRVLGVDPGLTRCGYGIIDGEPGRRLALVATGVVSTRADDEIGPRLLALEEQVERWLADYRPDAVAVERVFSQHNVRTVMGTAQAGAVAIVCAARRNLPVALHTPSEVKAAVTGSGRADKAQVTQMVTRLLALHDPPRPADSADALALAICHLWRGGAQRRLALLAGGTTPRTPPAPAHLPIPLHGRQGRPSPSVRLSPAGIELGPGASPVLQGGASPAGDVIGPR